MILRSFFFTSVFRFLFITSTYAADDWCIQDPENLPCNGAPGRCTINSNGDPGGFVAHTATVNQTGWIRSRNQPYIGLQASICDHAQVFENASIYRGAHVSGRAEVYGGAHVYGRAEVHGDARVYGSARVYGNAQVYGDAHVSEHAHVYGNARVYRDAQVFRNAQISGNAQIFGNAWVYGTASISGDAKVSGNVHVAGAAQITTGNIVAGVRIGNPPMTCEYEMDSGYRAFAYPEFGSYESSEASELAREWQKRIETGLFLEFCGHDSIYTTPSVYEKKYIMKDALLAEYLRCEVGTEFTETSIMANAAFDHITVALTEPGKIEIQEDAMNPLFNSRPVPESQQKYLDYLKSTIAGEIEKLNQEKGQVTFRNGKKYYANELGYEAQGSLCLHEHLRDQTEFAALIHQIENNNEQQFIKHLMRLVTTFDSQHTEAKFGFIDVMTHLFVTKKFPSDGMRLTYTHFMLRCGQIY